MRLTPPNGKHCTFLDRKLISALHEIVDGYEAKNHHANCQFLPPGGISVAYKLILSYERGID